MLRTRFLARLAVGDAGVSDGDADVDVSQAAKAVLPVLPFVLVPSGHDKHESSLSRTELYVSAGHG